MKGFICTVALFLCSFYEPFAWANFAPSYSQNRPPLKYNPYASPYPTPRYPSVFNNYQNPYFYNRPPHFNPLQFYRFNAPQTYGYSPTYRPPNFSVIPGQNYIPRRKCRDLADCYWRPDSSRSRSSYENRVTRPRTQRRSLSDRNDYTSALDDSPTKTKSYKPTYSKTSKRKSKALEEAQVVTYKKEPATKTKIMTSKTEPKASKKIAIPQKRKLTEKPKTKIMKQSKKTTSRNTTAKKKFITKAEAKKKWRAKVSKYVSGTKDPSIKMKPAGPIEIKTDKAKDKPKTNTQRKVYIPPIIIQEKPTVTHPKVVTPIPNPAPATNPPVKKVQTKKEKQKTEASDPSTNNCPGCNVINNIEPQPLPKKILRNIKDIKNLSKAELDRIIKSYQNSEFSKRFIKGLESNLTKCYDFKCRHLAATLCRKGSPRIKKENCKRVIIIARKKAVNIKRSDINFLQKILPKKYAGESGSYCYSYVKRAFTKAIGKTYGFFNEQLCKTSECNESAQHSDQALKRAGFINIMEHEAYKGKTVAQHPAKAIYVYERQPGSRPHGDVSVKVNNSRFLNDFVSKTPIIKNIHDTQNSQRKLKSVWVHPNPEALLKGNFSSHQPKGIYYEIYNITNFDY